MSDKIKKVYEALVEGAVAGESGKGLYAYVKDKCPKATSKRIVKASLLALSDPGVKDANVLQVIYALAIKHRLDPVSAEDLEPEADELDAVNEAKAATVEPEGDAKTKSRRKKPSANPGKSGKPG